MIINGWTGKLLHAEGNGQKLTQGRRKGRKGQGRRRQGRWKEERMEKSSQENRNSRKEDIIKKERMKAYILLQL